jgi:drug/metabolite transporter (DMT)-like permease
MWTLALVWGASYLFIKIGLDGGFGPIFLVFARIALGAAVLVPLAARAGALGRLRGRWPSLAVLGLLSIVVPFLLITYGERHIASSLAGILVAATPIFTVLLVMAGIGTDVRLTAWGAVGMGVGILGVALLLGVDLTGSTEALAGGLMVVTAALCYAAGALYLRRRLSDLPPIGVAAGSTAASAVLTAPLAVAQIPAALPSAGALAAVAALGALGTGLAFLIYYLLIAQVGATKAAVVTYLAPGFALAYGVLFLHEPLTAGALGGLALILAGCWLAAEGRAPWRRKGAPEPAAATG